MGFITRTNKKGDTELSILIPDNWGLVMEGDGSLVFSTDEQGETNALQISTLTFSEDKSSELTEKKLVIEAKKLGERSKFGKPVKTESGSCQTGDYGSAVYEDKKNNKFLQVWYISDGEILTFATFMCELNSPEEIKEQAGEIAKRVRVEKK